MMMMAMIQITTIKDAESLKTIGMDIAGNEINERYPNNLVS